MIPQVLLDRFVAALLMGEPLKLPSRMYLTLVDTRGKDIGLLRQSLTPGNWQWKDGAAVNTVRVQFDETAEDMGQIAGARLADEDGETVATFSMLPRSLERRTIVIFEPGDLSISLKGN